MTDRHCPAALSSLPSTSSQARSHALFIDTFFENASILGWEQIDTDIIAIRPIPDHQRFSPNMQASHVHLKLHVADPVAQQQVRLQVVRLDNCWNGKREPAIYDTPMTWVVSPEHGSWQYIVGIPLDDPNYAMAFDIPVTSPCTRIARMVPYTEQDLQHWLTRIMNHPLVQIETIGHTVEGRPLEMVRVGHDHATDHVLLRARAHPWETAGNWLMEGLVEQLLNDDAPDHDVLQHICFWLMPMANKDGVYRGLTRFNIRGMDLNRNWDQLADPQMAPENTALEQWIQQHQTRGKKISLAMCLHNDSGGQLHPGHTTKPGYTQNMQRLEELFRKHTWFTQGSQPPGCGGQDVFTNGLTDRYGIDAIVVEFNTEYIAGLDKPPLHTDWITFGRQLVPVLTDYFDLSH